jgi:hypothetical protein
MDFLNYIGKDCRNLIYSNLSNAEKFPILFVNKKYKEEISKLFHCVIHYDCFSLKRKHCKHRKKPCFATILPDLIKKNYLENLKTYYNIFQDDTVLFYIFYYSALYEQNNIFKEFFIIDVNKSNKIINWLIILVILEKESIELVKFMFNNSFSNMFQINLLGEIKNIINSGYIQSIKFQRELKEFVFLQEQEDENILKFLFFILVFVAYIVFKCR